MRLTRCWQTEDLWLHRREMGGIPNRVTPHAANDNFPFWLSNAAEVDLLVQPQWQGGVVAEDHDQWCRTEDSRVRVRTALSTRARGRWTASGSCSLVRQPNGDFDIGARRVDGSGEPKWLLNTEFDERRPVLSPDGEWLAYYVR